MLWFTKHFINKHNVKCKPYGPWGHFLGQCTLKLITLCPWRSWRPRGAQQAFLEGFPSRTFVGLSCFIACENMGVMILL